MKVLEYKRSRRQRTVRRQLIVGLGLNLCVLCTINARSDARHCMRVFEHLFHQAKLREDKKTVFHHVRARAHSSVRSGNPPITIECFLGTKLGLLSDRERLGKRRLFGRCCLSSTTSLNDTAFPLAFSDSSAIDKNAPEDGGRPF